MENQPWKIYNFWLFSRSPCTAFQRRLCWPGMIWFYLWRFSSVLPKEDSGTATCNFCPWHVKKLIFANHTNIFIFSAIEECKIGFVWCKRMRTNFTGVFDSGSLAVLNFKHIFLVGNNVLINSEQSLIWPGLQTQKLNLSQPSPFAVLLNWPVFRSFSSCLVICGSQDTIFRL